MQEDGDFVRAELCQPLSTFCPGSSRLEDELFFFLASPRDNAPLSSPVAPALLPAVTPDAR